MVATDTKNRVGGTVFVKIDGVQIKCRGTWTLDMGEPKLEAVTGNDGVHGYTETPKPPKLTGEVTPDDARKLARVRNSTITVEWGAGKADALRGAFFTGDGEIDLVTGAQTVEFSALSCEPVKR